MDSSPPGSSVHGIFQARVLEWGAIAFSGLPYFLLEKEQSQIPGCPGGSEGKDSPAVKEMWVRSLGWEDPLEKDMATYSIILAWEIPWTEEPGGL